METCKQHRNCAEVKTNKRKVYQKQQEEDSLETKPGVNKRDPRRDKLYIMNITGS